jgi:hypothetical protein
VNTLFIGLVAALALAFGLAFGLGGRDVAGELTRSWYESSKATADRVKTRAEVSTATERVTTSRSSGAPADERPATKPRPASEPA